MILDKIELHNFRNHKKLVIDFKKVTVLFGSNGIGKTNLIEALNILSTGFSWRTRKEEELINFFSDYSRLVADTKDKKIEIYLEKNNPKKIIKINKVKKKIIDLLGNIPSVLFTAESLNIIIGSPQSRRSFLDFLIIQTDKIYSYNLALYYKIIKERNALLYGINIGKNEANELDFWDKKLVESGSYLIKKRQEIAEQLNKLIKNYYPLISQKKHDELNIKYVSTINNLDEYEKILHEKRAKEIYCKNTIYGPHRDDLQILLNDKEARNFASRGEIRSVVLALKYSESQYLKNYFKTAPLILLDDIFSELDNKRKENIQSIIDESQTIITAANLEEIPKSLQKKAKIIKI